jgi:hypothetical protein
VKILDHLELPAKIYSVSCIYSYSIVAGTGENKTSSGLSLVPKEKVGST